MDIRLLIGIFMVSSWAWAEDAAVILVDIEDVSTTADVIPIDGIRSSGQPDEQALALLADAGYTAIVDFRGENESRGLDEAAAAKRLGLDYVSLPVTSPDAISFENAARLDQILDELEGPALLHCGSGNRVGALLALLKSSQGATDEEALEYGRSAGLTGLESVVKSRLADKD
jgi:uncharacterized protein (TIGR01244 family)